MQFSVGYGCWSANSLLKKQFSELISQRNEKFWIELVIFNFHQVLPAECRG